LLSRAISDFLLAAMTEEQSHAPASRRPIAAVFRRTAEPAVRLCVGREIHADVVSVTSAIAAALAGELFILSRHWPWLLLIAPLLCYARLWLNMLDGMVALASGTASPRGEIFNELPDRVSDIVIFVGVAHSGWCHPLLGYWAAIAALMTAYAGTLGQAVAGRREFGGMMAKPFRMVMLHAGAWGTWLLIVTGSALSIGGLKLLDWTCALIIAGCVQTVIVRLLTTMRRLRDG
jgi:phosphatidylglycerophosphate synthase